MSSVSLSTEEDGSIQWYPSRPPQDTLEDSVKTSETLPTIPSQFNEAYDLPAIFQELQVKYTISNLWHFIPREVAAKARRGQVKGVEARKLPKNHFLAGQYGLFTTRKFTKFDIVGEYTGKVVGDTVNGHYVAALEDCGHEESLGLDAAYHGNEMRFINSYLNIDFKANVTMRTAYISGLPHLVIVCMEDIDVGEELLLDYGEAYNTAYLLPKIKQETICSMNTQEMLESLPFGGEESSNDEEEEEREVD